MKRHLSVAVLGLGLCIAGLAPAAQATTYTKAVRYGPFALPAGTATSPGHLNNRLMFAVRRPCADCFITSFKPNLVYEDGTPATMETGPMLHHAVFTSQFKGDATCSGTWLGLAGERFFASGDERTEIGFPAGYGYRVRWYDSWNLLVDLMNHATQARTVYLQVTYRYRPSWESVRRLRPVWLDIDQCGDSEYQIPAGPSDMHRDWSVNVPGAVMTAAGHVHGHGKAVEATNESRGGVPICKSVATPDPMDAHRIVSMSTCTANQEPIARLAQGEVVKLHSMYESPHPADDVMGIMLMYINPQ